VKNLIIVELEFLYTSAASGERIILTGFTIQVH